MAQWIEHWPGNRKVAGLIPSQAHAWVAGQVPSWGGVRGNHILMFLSFSFSLKVNKVFKKINEIIFANTLNGLNANFYGPWICQL